MNLSGEFKANWFNVKQNRWNNLWQFKQLVEWILTSPPTTDWINDVAEKKFQCVVLYLENVIIPKVSILDELSEENGANLY